MLGRGLVCVAALVVLGLGACGGDDDGGSDPPPKEPVARCTPAPAKAKSIAMKPKWKIGDRRTAEIQKSREDSGGSEPLHVDGTAQVQVIDTGPDGSSLRWQSGPVAFPTGALLADDNQFDELEEKLDPLRIEYSTDADGVIDQVGNLSSLRTQVSAMLTTLTEDVEPAEVENLRRLVESDAFLESAMVEDPGNLHFLYGVKIARGETVTADFELPNPLGGEPIPSTLRYTLTTMRDRSGCAVVDATIDADEDAFAKVVREGVSQLVPGESLDESDLENAGVRHEMSFSYDPGSGWIARADAKKILTFGDRKRTERTLMVTR